MWALVGSVLAHGGGAVGAEAGQEDRALDLGARHRQAVVDPVQPTTAHDQRRETTAVAAVDRGPHDPQRPGHAVHGAPARRSVADEHGQAVERGRPAGEQADPGAGVADVDHTVGLPQARRCPRTTTSPVRVGHQRRPESSIARAGAAHVVAVGKTAQRRRPSARAARSRARCEIDLSPGTRKRPRRPLGGRRHGE